MRRCWCGASIEGNHKYCDICAPLIEREMNRERCQRFRERHGNDHVIKWCRDHPEERRLHSRNWMHRHPEEHKKSLNIWRRKNPGKVRDQNRRAKKNRRRRMLYKRWYCNNREIVVAVTCIFCGEFVTGKGGKKLCRKCFSKWSRSIPYRVLYEIATWPSFERMPHDLLIWKRIMDLRKDGVTKLKVRCVP